MDHTCLVFVHEHAEANDHKNNGMSLIVAGHAGGMKTGLHTRTTGTVADLYMTVVDRVMNTGMKNFPSSENRELTWLFA